MGWNGNAILGRISSLFSKIPPHVKSGTLAWSIVLGTSSLIVSTLYVPSLQPVALLTSPVLIASEPLVRRHQEKMSLRKLDRQYRLQQKAEGLEAVRLPHRNRGKQARAIDQTQLLIERALEFDGESTVIPMGGGKRSYRYTRYFFMLQTATRMANLQACLPKMRSSLALADKQSLTIQEYLPNQQGFAVDVGLPEPAWTSPMIDTYLTAMPQTKLLIPLGIDDTDNLQCIDVYDESQELSSILVGGMPGSGKSNYLRSIVRWLIHNYAPSIASILLVDLKQPGASPTFDDFLGIPHLNGHPIATSVGELVTLLEGLEDERQARQKLFASEGFVDIKSFNQNSSMRIPDIFVLIDEAAEAGTVKGGKKHGKLTEKFEELADVLNRKGRSAGIRLIYGYHRTSEMDIPVTVRSNCSHNICFRVRDQRNAALVLGKELEDSIITIPPGLTKGEFVYNDRRFTALFTPTLPDEGVRLASDVLQASTDLPALPESTSAQVQDTGREETLRSLYKMFRDYDIHKDEHSVGDFITTVLKEKSANKRATRLKDLKEAVDKFADGDIANILEVEPDITPEQLAARIYGKKIKHAKPEVKEKYYAWAKGKIAKLAVHN